MASRFVARCHLANLGGITIADGEPTERCRETADGVFRREWTKATVTVDCNAYTGDVRLKTSDDTVSSDLATTSMGCRTDHDCQLNGLCTAGRCDCDAMWGGEHCEVLLLEGEGALAYGGPDSTVSSWGGGPPAFDSATGNWTLFVTEIAEHCGLNAWEHQSTIVAATARSPTGPFERQRVAVPYQAQ